MIKHLIPAALGLLCTCLPATAQQSKTSDRTVAEVISQDELRQTGEVDAGNALTFYRSDILSTVDSSLLVHGLPVMTLLDGRRFPIASSLGRMGMTPLNLFPIAFLSAVEVRKPGTTPIAVGSDLSVGSVDLRLNRDYTHGEVGVFFGKSGGRYGHEDFQSYIIGGTGTDKFHITAGAAYQESTGRVSRSGHW